MKQRSLILAVLACGPWLASPATAQSTNGAAGGSLQAICNGMLEQGVGVSGNKDKLCTCLVRETSTQLSPAEMKAYSQSTLNGQEPPASVMAKVMTIATGCLKEAD